MDGQYDSILKEKKKYTEEVKPKKKSVFKICFFVDLLLVVIILVVSYNYYYNNVLSTSNIVINNSKELLSPYEEFFKYLYLDDILSDGTLDGELKLNDDSYKFNLSKLNGEMSINLDNGNDKINYYYGDNGVFYQIESISDKYIKSLSVNRFQGIKNFSSNLISSISNKRVTKKLYLNDNNPTVEVNMNLSSEDISNIIFNLFLDKYEVIMTIKNGALSNDILSEKIVLNNQTKNIRSVYLYENGIWTLTNNDGKKIRYELDLNKKILKFFHDDELYSVLKYTLEDDKAIYNYQVINEYYTLNLSTFRLDNHYVYEFSSSIGDDREKDNVVIEFDKGGSTNVDSIDSLINKNTTKEDNIKYRTTENKIIGNLRNFVDKYKNGIDNINNY